MISPKHFIDCLSLNGVDFYTGVPDSLLKDICAYISDNTPTHKNIIAANEGTATGIAAGHYLATGNMPMVYMQNSGIGNAVNPLLSLADEKVYSMPILLMIGWRGEPGVHDEPQHMKQGEVTLSLLEAMGIPYAVLDSDEKSALKVVSNIVSQCKKMSKPHALVIRKGTFKKYSLSRIVQNHFPLTREQAVQLVVSILPEDTLVIATTGKLSRELYEYRDSKSHSHAKDFLTVGSMGHASSIALGLALGLPERQVVCLDGDGAFIMHMGALTNIGALKPHNLMHILFNNGAHESVGAQPTQGFNVDCCAIARACGYTYATTVLTKEEITAALNHSFSHSGPVFIEIKVNINSRADLGRPKSTPAENKYNFMHFIQNGS